MIWTCPFCSGELIFTGRRSKKFGEALHDTDASFYTCNCVPSIISQAFKNKDGTPKIFYNNKWKHLADGRWMFLESGRVHCTWRTPKDVPIKNRKEEVQFT
jgi:hypothetical protein